MRKCCLESRHTPEEVAAWFPDIRKWPTEDLYRDGCDHLLIVYFMDDCPKEWKYCGKSIIVQDIMDVVNNTWKRHFILEQQARSYIRVTFKGML